MLPAASMRAQVGRLLVVAGAVSVLLTHPLPGPRESSAPGSPRSAAADGRWSFGLSGWFVSVDGAEVDLPSLADQMRPRVRIRGPQPLSRYDHLIARHAQAQGFDWRLVAAVIFEESRFQPEAHSPKGAYGLMQVRPIAAEAVGERRFQAPNDNIRTGARYLKQLSDTFDDAHGRDRLALVLAAYNMGPGHVRDAQTLAKRVGYDPAVWAESMELIVPLLEEPQVHKRLPNGYAQGRTTVDYVNRVLARYDRYRGKYGRTPWRHNDEGADADYAASANG